MNSNLKLGEQKILTKIKEECEILAEKNNKPVGIYYDRKIKEIISEYKGNPSDKTKEEYRKIFSRLIQDPKNKNTALSIILMNAGSKSSFDLYRSAFRFCLVEYIELSRKKAENCRVSKDYEGMKKATLDALKLAVVFQYQFLSHEKITFNDVKTKSDYKKKHRSKKKNLKNLVEYGVMIDSLNDSQKDKYSVPLSIYGLFGIRPAELQKGINLACAEENGKKVIFSEIQGAKLGKNKGQEKRYCKIILDPKSSADNNLYELIKSNGGKMSYSQSKQNYEALRKLMSRNFKGASPYSYRHRVASDLKASGLSKTTIAMFLGHANDKSQSHYGYKQHGKSRGLSATASKPINEVASDYGYYKSRKTFTSRLQSALNKDTGKIPSSPGTGSKLKI